ncbi:MAG: type II toxin-antitoxin system RelE/ParE family toxin [Bacteroidetes bacterium]|nr:type II toxin-antitoxin system RelE/ParE family toxin [Bacteroidota bacterium]
MKNGYKIVWSNEARDNLSQIIDYFEEKWTERELKKFFQRLEKIINLISQNPRLFMLTKKRKNVRRCVLSKQTSIYYKFDSERIFIITLFDNRQNPKSLKI